ncbi:MAG: hypothetical protein QXJ51_00620 [Sulfolobales archaeon]
MKNPTRKRLKLARALIELNKSLVELRILRERILRRISTNMIKERDPAVILQEVDRYIVAMEILSERINRMMDLASLTELLEVSQELRTLQKELRKVSSSASINLLTAVEMIDDLINESKQL